jgi:tetratricopeptide (TPR) repeat protein
VKVVHKATAWLFLLVASSAFAQHPDQNALVQSVFHQLLAVPAASRPESRYTSWPPQVSIISTQQGGVGASEQPELNAYASSPDCRPAVHISEGLVSQIVQGDPDVLALILGHELGHILLGHPSCAAIKDRASFLEMAISRDQEYAADAKGYELALAAGYSVRRGLRGLRRLDEISHYSSYEALTADHPSWTDRLARLDKEQAPLWRSMSAFNDGVSFLATENYQLAAECFRSVAREFPQAADVKGDLGYALLMEYIDQLSDEDMQALGIGQIATGSFYGESLYLKSKVRGRDAALWSEAVQILKSAEEQDPKLSLVKANLGLAYLVQPTGSDAQQALSYLVPAVNLLKGDSGLHSAYGVPAAHAVINNAAIAYLAAGDREHAVGLLQFLWSDRGQITNEQLLMQAAALFYNTGSILSTSQDPKERSAASEILLQYLRVETPSSLWWRRAYVSYSKVCPESSNACVEEAQLRKSNHVPLRTTVAVDLGDAKTVRIEEPFQDAVRSLGRSVFAGAVPGSGVQRTHFPQYPLDVLSSDVVLAIILNGSSAPGLHLRRVGIGGGADSLRVGMTVEQVEKVLADQPYRYEGLVDSWKPYRFYLGVGIALRLGSQETVDEIVVVRSTVRSESD